METAMSAIIAIDLKTLITMVMIVAVQGVGITSWLKAFSKCPTGTCALCKKCRRKTKYAVWSFAVLIPCAFMNTTIVAPIATAIFDIIFLGLAVMQLAYKSITNGVPNVVNALFDKAAGMRNTDSKDGKGSN